ncbi:hypothetical protein LEM8419_00902 [Neolewinella maritima]|uniref:DUF4380 domain-containing protein n=1 Tax=Neolewinella maritima TaxID=1383882 RepID=A0ABM9AY15_9BACT|nr:DUF4380 domain-containing protein [Neolewinella maritima]CAH0999602.1 hypothetical protein LEM8419_00902 [Neolewinella maritima]
MISRAALLLVVILLCTCDPAPQDITEVDYGGPLTITRDSISLTVDPAYGARLTSVTYGDRELLYVVRDSSGFTYGSTAWPSPQADWDWPPPATLDREPYTVQKVEEHSILLESREDSSGLVLQKRYRLGPDSDIGLTYWLTYNGPTTRSVAAWEVTRLPYTGRIVFFADSVRTVGDARRVVESQDSLRVIHFDERHTATTKVFADLDSVPVRYYTDGLILEKHTVVQDFYRVAPGHAPLEVYIDPPRGFVELELQGDYRKLSYGKTTTLRTKWRVVPDR